MYGDTHKQFLQYMLKNSFLSAEKALNFCRAIKAEAVMDLNSLSDFTSEINTKISKQELKILIMICEVTGEKQVILINTANDDISRLQNSFSQVELEFFQALMQEIVTSKDKQLAHIYCLNVSSTLTKKLSHSSAEKLIDKWIKLGYLRLKNDIIYLGARSIMEFTTFFQSHCKDYITKCDLCFELVFTGRTCGSCKKIMHNHCLEKFLVKRNLCPGCKKEWHDYKEAEHTFHDDQDQDSHMGSTDEEDLDELRRNKRKR